MKSLKGVYTCSFALTLVILLLVCYPSEILAGDVGEGPDFFDGTDLAVYPLNAKITKWFPFRAALAAFGLFVVPVGAFIFWLFAAPVI